MLLSHEKSTPAPGIQASPIVGNIEVDGKLDEPFWKDCDVGSGFVDQRTQSPAKLQSLVRVAYSAKYLFVAIECLDDQPEGIRASEQREDRFFSGDDWVEVHFDPAHGHRSKYAFFCNPLGTKADANEGPSGNFNFGWSTEWNAAARILSDRWVVEMRIPLGAMNYERRDGRLWGFNVTRQVRRTDSLSFWSFSPTDMYRPHNFGHLTGLDLARSEFDRKWEISPYASIRADFGSQDEWVPRAGLDVGFRLTPSITTALTLWPDYGQVEADADTIELRDTERFLPEKRPFFREGNELIRTPHRLYYSRRFADIDAGANVSGQWRQFGFSFLNVYGDVEHDGSFYGNNTVLRVVQDVGERSSLGYYLNWSELNEGYSRVADVDAQFYLHKDWRWDMQFSIANDNYTIPESGQIKDRVDYLGHGELVYEKYPWQFSAGYRAITEGFNPLLGFIPRQDVFGPALLADYFRQDTDRWYKTLGVGYEFFYFENDAGVVSVRDHAMFSRLVFRNDLGLRFAQSSSYHEPYQNWRTRAGVSLFTSDMWRSVGAGWATGEFENIDYTEIEFEKPFKPWEWLPIQFEFAIRFEEKPLGESDTVWLNRVVFDLFLEKDMWIKGSLQHQAHGIHNISLIYGWQVRKGAWWYVVINSLDDTETEATQSLFSKVVYTF